MNTDTLVILLIFLEYVTLFWMITSVKNVNNFQIAKFHSHGFA